MSTLKIFLSLIIIPVTLLCKPPIEELVKIHTPFVFNNHFYLSPLHGAIGAEGNLLKNMWLYYDTKSSMVKLLKTLFVVEEGDEFSATSYQPYCRFTPLTIGMLVSHAYDKTLFNEDENNNSLIIKELRETFKGPKNPNRVQKLLTLIKKSLQEEDTALFPKGTTFQILLAFLYLQANSTDDLEQYTTYLSQYFDLNSDCREPKTTHSQSPLMHQILHMSPEQIITQKLTEKMVALQRPPTLYWKRNVSYNENKPISDCCETAIREIINLLLFDPQTKNFDISRLPRKIGQKLPFPIIEFYQTHNSGTMSNDVNNLQSHRDWMHVVTNLPSIMYRQEDHEIDPSLLNIMSCLSMICGMKINKNKFLTKKMFIKKICKKLSNPALYIIDVENIFNGNSNAVDILFKLSYTQDSKIPFHSFTLHIRKDHAWINHIAAKQNSSCSLIEYGSMPVSLDYLTAERIKERLQDTHEFHPALHDLSTLYASYIVDNSCLTHHFHKAMLFSLDTDSNLQKYQCFRRLLAYYNQSADPDAYAYILGILKSLSNSFRLGQCFQQLLYKHHTKPEVKKIVEEKYSLLTRADQQSLMLCCAQKKLWQDETYRNIILAILMSLNNYASSEQLFFDNKIFTLRQLILCDAQKDPTIKIALTILINGLTPKKRLLRFQKA